MTDLRRFLDLLADFGLRPRIETGGRWLEDDFPGTKTRVWLEQYDDERDESNPKVDGYSGFYAVWYFDADGGFLGTAAWE